MVLASLGICCRAHPEQCSLAEFAAYICRDVAAHIDLATEARSLPKKRVTLAEDSDSDTATDASSTRKCLDAEFCDLGGGDADAPQLVDECDEDVAQSDHSNFPLKNVLQAISMALQQEDVKGIARKTRISHSDRQLLDYDASCKELMEENFSMQTSTFQGHTLQLGKAHGNAVALQKRIIELARKQQTPYSRATRRLCPFHQQQS